MAAVIMTRIIILLLLQRSICAAIVRTRESRGSLSFTPLSLYINLVEVTVAYLALSQ